MTSLQDSESSPAGGRQAKVVATILRDDGIYPNNERLPLLYYQGAIEFGEDEPAATVEHIFHSNGWGGSWRDGVYSFHHYHSTAHEALGCYAGSATVQLGGESGIVVEVTCGDVVIIPAGVAHKNLEHSPDFRVVGAYPEGTRPDMNYGNASERPAADERIAQLALPGADPVYGASGPLIQRWHK